ncbi:MAG: peptidylprolyl isomerase [Lysobacterales bacterium]
MKLISIVLTSLLLITTKTVANEPVDENEILAQRGKGVITYQQFNARVDKIPADVRLPTLRNGKRLQDVLASLLLRSQLAADAREAGFDKELVVIDRMKMAAQSELAEAWLAHYVATQPKADFEQLAYERYQLNQANMLSSPMVNVSHILVSTKERPDHDAKARAESVYQQLVDNPAAFDELVAEYSEDPSASSNKGKFSNVKKGDMVKAFEEAAFAMQPGEISKPVKTDYGYHVIRLDAYIEPKKMEFDDVKAQLIDQQRINHEERIKRTYLESLTTLDVQMSEAQLEEMVRRQFGEEHIGSEGKTGNKE